MGEGLYKRVQAILRTRGMSEDYLGKLMIDRGMQYRPVYMDSFATPDDIRVISGMLQVAPSILFEATPLVDELIGALFEERGGLRGAIHSHNLQVALSDCVRLASFCLTP